MPDPPVALAPLHAPALARWLNGPAVLADDGRVWSWHNPAHPGYAYPEAAGLWLGWHARQPQPDADRGDRVDRWLAACIESHGIGRQGRRYLFDHGMVLAGRLAWAQHRGRALGALDSSVTTLLDDLDARRATTPPMPDERWSAGFGAHLLKLALPLATWVEATADHRAATALQALPQRLAAVMDDGRIRTTGSGGPTYLHAHCYAAEGLWRLSTSPVGASQQAGARAQAERAAAWLASVQRPDGGLPPWHDGQRGWGPAPADVAAQSIRLWCGLDAATHADAIERALSFLERACSTAGGMRYHEGSQDQNTWASLFTVQALEFASGHADVRELV